MICQIFYLTSFAKTLYKVARLEIFAKRKDIRFCSLLYKLLCDIKVFK